MGVTGYAAGDGDGKRTVEGDFQASGFSIWVDVPIREMGGLEEVTFSHLPAGSQIQSRCSLSCSLLHGTSFCSLLHLLALVGRTG